MGKVAQTAGSLPGDRALQAEGRALGRRAQRNILRVSAQPDGSGWWKPEGAGQISSVHRPKDEAVGVAREWAKAREPSQMVVYEKDGTVQTERTYG